MTRETKIGLLVGLAFIVVFAMLLSHSGPGTSPGDLRQLAKAKQPPTAPVVNETAPETNSPLASNPQPETTAMTEGSASPPKVDPPSPTVSEPDSLPNPDILNNTTPAGAEQPMMGVTDASDKASRLESTTPHAPPMSEVINPMPETRQTLPSRSPEPVADASHEEEHKTEVASAEPVQHSIEAKLSEIHAPTVKPETDSAKDAKPSKDGKEHVVQKGETLMKILKAEYPDAYGTSYKKLSSFFIAANRAHIKGEDTVIEGQKLVVPALPSSLSEPVSDGKVALNVSHKEANLIEATPKAADRKAPSKEAKVTETEKDKLADREKAADKEKDKSKDKDKLASGDKKKDHSKDKDKDADKVVTTAKHSKDTRSYEVQSKDNFTTIAQKELGSATFWREIKRLNPDVDPAKMKPGMKLILPAKRPLADTVASGRTK